MKLEKYKEEYQWYSGKASDVVRQLSFAGIAIIWLFRSQLGGIPKVPEELLLPLWLFCTALSSDLIQYFLGYLIWYSYYRYHEVRDKGENKELRHHYLLPIPLHIFMLIKVIVTIFAYYRILAFICNAGII